jgi:hypothetical protein
MRKLEHFKDNVQVQAVQVVKLVGPQCKTQFFHRHKQFKDFPDGLVFEIVVFDPFNVIVHFEEAQFD